jgi:molybdenum cofactor guanylyltransferase
VPDLGPLGGVLAGMRHAQAHLPAVRYILTVPVDAPFLPPNLRRRLGEPMRGGDEIITVAQSGGRLHHVVALWPVRLEAALNEALACGVRRVEAFAAAHDVQVVDWSLASHDPFMNINTPADLAYAHKILKLMLAT